MKPMRIAANCIILLTLAGTLACTVIVAGTGANPEMAPALSVTLHSAAGSQMLTGTPGSNPIDYCSFRDWRGRLNPHYSPFWCIFCKVFPDTPKCYA